MKRISIIPISIIFILFAIIIGNQVYINSDKYVYKVANGKRIDRLNMLDKIPRWYISLGVYRFTVNKTSPYVYTDKFGITSTQYNSKNVPGEFSFTDHKITIICDGIKEEIFIDTIAIRVNPKSSTDSMTTYRLNVKNWTAIRSSDSKLIYNNNAIKLFGESKFIDLIVSRKVQSNFTLISNSDKKFLEFTDSKDPRLSGFRRGVNGFVCAEGPEIYLEEANYLYDNKVPLYVQNAKYYKTMGIDVYDINTYLPNRK